MTFALHDSEETLKVYPYHFNLAVTYKIDGPRISVIWHVENTDTREIHFQIGGHPAFNVPDMEKGDKMHGSILLDNAMPLDGLRSHIDGSHEMVEEPVEADMGIIELTDRFFRNDSVKIHKSQTHRAALLNKDGDPVVTVDYKCPVIAFWFVCIEPWYGLGDPRGWKGEFKDKPMMNHLLPGSSFMSKYEITIG